MREPRDGPVQREVLLLQLHPLQRGGAPQQPRRAAPGSADSLIGRPAAIGQRAPPGSAANSLGSPHSLLFNVFPRLFSRIVVIDKIFCHKDTKMRNVQLV